MMDRKQGVREEPWGSGTDFNGMLPENEFIHLGPCQVPTTAQHSTSSLGPGSQHMSLLAHLFHLLVCLWPSKPGGHCFQTLPHSPSQDVDMIV